PVMTGMSLSSAQNVYRWLINTTSLNAAFERANSVRAKSSAGPSQLPPHQVGRPPPAVKKPVECGYGFHPRLVLIVRVGFIHPFAVIVLHSRRGAGQKLKVLLLTFTGLVWPQKNARTMGEQIIGTDTVMFVLSSGSAKRDSP